MKYVVRIGVTAGTSTQERHYNAGCFCRTDELFVHAVSDEEAAHPYVPRGVKLYFTIALGMGGGGSTIIPTRLNKISSVDPLGVPELEPTFSFGLAERRAKVNVETIPLGSHALRVIANLEANARHYVIRFCAASPREVADEYHLCLTPLENPDEYRLRQLWIEQSTFQTISAVVASNFSGPWRSEQSWTITFSFSDGFAHIISEVADAPLRFRGYGEYTSAIVSFERLRMYRQPPRSFRLAPMPMSNVLREPGS